MPSRSQYTPLPTSSADTDEPCTTASPSTPSHRAPRPPSALALEVDALFRRWTTTIAHRIKLKKKRAKNRRNLVEERDRDVKVEILESVFERWIAEEVAPEGKGKGKEKEDEFWTLDHEPPMTEEAFNELVDRVRQAIEAGVQPRLNSKGSSGSYFARDATGATLAIFKPKDEEPYGRLNPKLTKWIHRNFFSKIIPFGRACLIPQLSYLSESAASLLSRRLSLHIVPRTEVVALSSPAFFYDWIDIERAGRKGRLPEKDGSFQVFLKGFTDASVFLAQHPWPGRPLAEALEAGEKRGGRAKRRKRGGVSIFGPLRCLCGRAEAEDDEDEGHEQGEQQEHEQEAGFRWTDELMQSFREQLEGLVVLDYLIRNTDRGLDNFMLKPCLCASPHSSTSNSTSPLSSVTTTAPLPRAPMTELPTPPSTSSSRSIIQTPHIHVAAIDNSLAFPHAHPSGWRTFTYGWLHLPASLIGQPFSTTTRERFLPLLTDPSWWEETTLMLRDEFEKDHEFKEGMFGKQLAVMKGQAWNLVQSLLDAEEGPIELCRRKKKLVWDDFIEVPDDERTQSLLAATHAPPPPPTTLLSGDDGTGAGSNLLPQPITEDPTSPKGHQSSPPLPIASLPNPSISSSPPLSRRPVQHHRRTGSATVSSVLSSHAFPEAVTGVEVVRTLDLAEREERKRGHGIVVEEEEEESEEEEDAEVWGVRSEGDVRTLLGRSAPMPSISVFASTTDALPFSSASTSWNSRDRLSTSRGTLSFDEPRSSNSNGWRHVSDSTPTPSRARSDSLTSHSPKLVSSDARPKFARKAFSSSRGASMNGKGRPRLHGRSTSEVGRSGRRREGWLNGLGASVEEGEEHGEEVRRKVVVVERLEELKDEPRKWWIF